jgi:hypothetical protein
MLNMAIKRKNSSNNESSVSTTWLESAKISLILTLAQVFLAFLTLYDWNKITSDPPTFLFDLFKYFGASFFGTFIAITELSKYFSK